MKVVYRRYASLFFLVGIDDEEVSCAELPDAFALSIITIHKPCRLLSASTCLNVSVW